MWERCRARDAPVKTTQNSKKAASNTISVLINDTEKRNSRDRQTWSRGVWCWGAIAKARPILSALNPNPNSEQGTLFRCTTTTIANAFISRLLTIQNVSKCTAKVELISSEQIPQLFGSLPTYFESLFKPFLFYLQLFLPSVPA